MGTWYRRRIYHKGTKNTYKKLHIIEGDTVLDIGGHIGCSARYFVTKGAKAVYSYEPMQAISNCYR